MDEELVFNSSYSKLQNELTEAESKLHLARTQRNEAMTRIGELVKELEQCKAPESREAEAERERKALIADRLKVPSCDFLGPHVMLALDERDHLRSELAMAMQAVKNLEIACEQSEDELKALKAAASGGEVYVTGNGQPFTIIKDGVPLVPAGVPSVAPPADQVEALARVLLSVFSNNTMSFERTHYTKEWMAVARAAIAHLNTRPEGLPTADELAQIYNRIYYGSAPEKCRVNWESIPEACREDMVRGTEAILTALRPWLRDPVGCELNVHPDQLELYKWVTEPDGGYAYAAQQALDLCRSRIRPVYECDCSAIEKERDLLKAELRSLERQNSRLGAHLDTARAALEGE